MSKKIVVLLDSNNTLYRIYHTQPPKTVNGHRIESANGVISEALRFRNKDSVSAVVSFFDANSKNFRHDLDPNYKSERSGMPEDLRPQEDLAQEGLVAAGFPLIVKEGFEADDSMGMVAEKFESEGFEVIISTTDKDMLQLVKGNVTVYNPVTKKRLDADAVFEKLGVRPEQVPDYLAIMGDKADGIPGVPKVGKKTAAKLVTEYGSIQGIIDASDGIKGVVGQNIRDFKDRLPLNLKLTTIESSSSHLAQDELRILSDSKIDAARCFELSNDYGLAISHLAGSGKPEASEKKTARKEDQPAMQGSLF